MLVVGIGSPSEAVSATLTSTTTRYANSDRNGNRVPAPANLAAPNNPRQTLDVNELRERLQT